MARTRAQDYDVAPCNSPSVSGIVYATCYSGTSISMIAEACGVSKALLYHYYPDKEAVLFDILFAHFSALIAAVEGAAGSERDPKERIYAIAAALLEAYRDADAEHEVQIANLKLLPSDQQEQLRNMERTIVSVLASALAEALPSIGRGPLLKPITMSVFGMLNWHYLWFREGRGLTRADYARLVTRLVIAGSAEAAAALRLRQALPKSARPKVRIAAGRNVRRRRGIRSAAR